MTSGFSNPTNRVPRTRCSAERCTAVPGRMPSTLVATHWWRSPTPAAVVRADALFGGVAIPWCGTYF